MNINNGVPAFPNTPDRTDPTGVGEWQLFTPGEHPGMSLRDYFAAKALQGMLARPGSVNPKQDAEFAYMLADAMLAARAA